MKNKSMELVMVFLISCGLCFSGVSAARAGTDNVKRIVDIQIKGNYSVSAPTILNRLKIKPGDVLDEPVLNKELKRLYAMGYFSDVSIATEEREGGAVVIISVIEKPLISAIEFQGANHIKAPRLRKKITIKEGDLLDFNRVSDDARAIKAYYTEEGYYNVGVDYKIDTDETGGKAVLVFIVDEGTPLRIKSISVKGNKNIKTGEITKLMATKPAFWFIQKGAFDDDKFQDDLSRIAAYYRSKGYLDARVSSSEEYSEDKKNMSLTVVIDEGKKYSVGDINIAGDLAFPEKEVRGIMAMKPGDPFDYEMMKEDIEKIRMFYYDKGYMDAEIDLQQKYNPTTGRMDILYEIVSHDEIYVGRVNIIGNTKTRDKVIRREIRVYPGEKYDGKTLKRSKEKIYNLGYFEDVFFETVPTGEKDVKDLNVTVKETKTGEFSFGGGYSSIDAFIGFVQVKQKNFDLLDFPTFTGAGQDLTIRAELGSARSNYFLSWTDPWIFNFPYLFGFDVYREEHDRFGLSGYDYDETRTGGSLRLGKNITDYLGSTLVYNLEEVKISNIPDDATDALRREAGSNVISRLTLSFTYDKRDNKFSPSKGYITGISLQDAGGFLGGDKDFVKGWLYGNYYHTLFKKVVLEVGASMGLSDAYGNSAELPIYERFFAGGADTVRGYRERGVGPRDRGSNTALGGEALLIGTTEVTFPIFENMLKGAVFYDVGNVWADTKELFGTGFKQDSGFKAGTGVGLRIKTPIGPVKLDYGYPLNDNFGDKREGQFYFSMSHGF